MEYYGKGIALVKISISYRGYLNFKAELPLVACNTCRPGTSTAVLNCFYTARTGWRFILSRRTAELNLQLSLSLSLLNLSIPLLLLHLLSPFSPSTLTLHFLFAYIALVLSQTYKVKLSSFSPFPQAKTYLFLFSIPQQNFLS